MQRFAILGTQQHHSPSNLVVVPDLDNGLTQCSLSRHRAVGDIGPVLANRIRQVHPARQLLAKCTKLLAFVSVHSPFPPPTEFVNLEG